MTPERNAKVGNKVTRNKSSIAEKILRLGLFTSMLFGCVPIEANVNPAANPSPGGETSTLPSEFTETPLPLPTETATEMPTATLTPEPTATATATEAYPIDLEKLATPPKSFEEFKQHPEKFVQAPNPMENFEEFIKWYNETLFEKALGGDLDKLPVNYQVGTIGLSDRIMVRNTTEGEVLSVPKFFYFKDQNQFYMGYIVTLEYNGYIESYTVIERESLILIFPKVKEI